MNNLPLVSIQILNWNRLSDTILAIKSALAQSYKNIEIVVIDNGSTEKGSESIKDIFPEIKYIKLPKNFGCPGGRNEGVKYCSGEYIFYLDNDGILHKDAVKHAVEIMESDNEIYVVGGKINLISNMDDIYDFEIKKVDYVKTKEFSGGISMHRKSLYNEIGYYNNDFIYGYEETHLGIRIITKGKKIVFTDSVILWHKKSDTARDEKTNIIRQYNNKLYTYWEFFPIKIVIIFTIWYFTIYTFNSFKKGYAMLFLKQIWSSLKKAIRIRKDKKNVINGKQYKYYQLLYLKNYSEKVYK